MALIGLVAWIMTALLGLYLLTIWLIEYDPDYQRAAATRLPVPVLCGHVLLAVAGLGSWVVYLITNKKVFCWSAAGALALIATLGLIMAVRWLGVYRARPSHPSARTVSLPNASPAESPAGWAATTIPSAPAAGWHNGRARFAESPVPPERHFPVPAVVAHGIFAVTTVTLVVLTAIEAAGS